MVLGEEALGFDVVAARYVAPVEDGAEEAEVLGTAEADVAARVVFALAFAFAFTFALAFALAMMFAFALAFALTMMFALALALTLTMMFAFALALTLTMMFAFALACRLPRTVRVAAAILTMIFAFATIMRALSTARIGCRVTGARFYIALATMLSFNTTFARKASIATVFAFATVFTFIIARSAFGPTSLGILVELVLLVISRIRWQAALAPMGVTFAEATMLVALGFRALAPRYVLTNVLELPEETKPTAGLALFAKTSSTTTATRG